MDIEQLKTFLKVAELKKLNRAAEELYISQSSIASRIKSMEEELGYPLFVRKGRVLDLTPKGYQFIPYAERSIELINEGLIQIKQKPTAFSIGSVPTVAGYLLPKWLDSFNQKVPEATPFVTTGSTPEIIEGVMNGRFDLGLVRGPIDHHGVEWVHISTDPIIPVVHRGHPWSDRGQATPEDFLHETIIALDRKTSVWSSIEDWFKQHGVLIKIGMELDHVETTKQMVMHRFGVAFIPQMTVEKELKDGEIIQIDLIPKIEITRETLLIRHKRKPLSEHAEQFWKFVHQ